MIAGLLLFFFKTLNNTCSVYVYNVYTLYFQVELLSVFVVEILGVLVVELLGVLVVELLSVSAVELLCVLVWFVNKIISVHVLNINCVCFVLWCSKHLDFIRV